MTYTNSGARELRKSAAATLAEVTPLLQGRSGLSQKAKVKNLKAARNAVRSALRDLEDAVDAAKSV